MVLSSPDARALTHLLARYSEPNNARGVFELVITVVPFIVIWALIWVAVDHGYSIGLLLVVPAAGFLVRLFMIQHDCGHGSFFFGRLANDWVGRAIGVVTLTPYDLWRRSHARHHASSGNLDRRGIGDIDTLTVREFRSYPRWRQILYRLYRHPIVMFGIGPSYFFIFQHRLPIGMMRNGGMPWLSTMGTNTAIAVLVAAMIWLVGFGLFLLIHLPIMVLAASIGCSLFSTNSKTPPGPMKSFGIFTKLPFMAVLTITCPLSCVGSRQTLAFTTFITYAVGSLAIGYLMYCGIIRSWLPSVELRCFKVYGACKWLCGTRRDSGLFRLKRQHEFVR